MGAADDLSDEAEGSLTSAGQMLAGGTAGPGESMTAEGSEPSAPLDPGSQFRSGVETDEPAPHADAGQRSYRRLVHGRG